MPFLRWPIIPLLSASNCVRSRTGGSKEIRSWTSLARPRFRRISSANVPISSSMNFSSRTRTSWPCTTRSLPTARTREMRAGAKAFRSATKFPKEPEASRPASVHRAGSPAILHASCLIFADYCLDQHTRVRIWHPLDPAKMAPSSARFFVGQFSHSISWQIHSFLLLHMTTGQQLLPPTYGFQVSCQPLRTAGKCACVFEGLSAGRRLGH
ncbi:hypothetical protein ACVWY3_004683 [Bradyrhizobium sp. USDA 4486]